MHTAEPGTAPELLSWVTVVHKTCTPLYPTDTYQIEEEEEEEEEADFPSQTTPEAISGKALEQINVTVRGHSEIPSSIAPLLMSIS